MEEIELFICESCKESIKNMDEHEKEFFEYSKKTGWIYSHPFMYCSNIQCQFNKNNLDRSKIELGLLKE